MKFFRYSCLGFAGIAWFVGFGANCLAQSGSTFKPYSTISAGAGTSTYLGELAALLPKALVTLPRYNLTVGYARQLTPKLAARASFTWARLVGDDYTYSLDNPATYAFAYVRNLHFRNDVKELALTGVYNLVPDGHTANRRAAYTPYVFAGIALLAHNPKALTPVDPYDPYTNPQRWVDLQPLGTAGQGQPDAKQLYPLLTASIPVGVGFRYKLNDQINLGFEIGVRYTLTDYLDDVANDDSYPDFSNLSELGILMSDRRQESNAARHYGNPDRYSILFDLMDTNQTPFETIQRTAPGESSGTDKYLLTTFSIQYIIPGRVRCPVPRKR
ncbi:DUF6089 family protein [Spirosoma sp. 209]|uniref:DUF6089 family protein n=1 Tax=Spirosoma sp. 209 TaxID=1955701 RepID=UPI001F36BF94|nr:DUF6089 family protein [Spirosoma sp. 209]